MNASEIKEYWLDLESDIIEALCEIAFIAGSADMVEYLKHKAI